MKNWLNLYKIGYPYLSKTPSIVWLFQLHSHSIFVQFLSEKTWKPVIIGLKNCQFCLTYTVKTRTFPNCYFCCCCCFYFVVLMVMVAVVSLVVVIIELLSFLLRLLLLLLLLAIVINFKSKCRAHSCLRAWSSHKKTAVPMSCFPELFSYLDYSKKW